jgi:hypothetical protein
MVQDGSAGDIPLSTTSTGQKLYLLHFWAKIVELFSGVAISLAPIFTFPDLFSPNL